MEEDNIKTLKKILEINGHILYKSLILIDDVYYENESEFLEHKEDLSDKELLGLWRYFLLENYEKEEFMYDTKVIGVETVEIEDGVEITEPIFEWEDLDYYYCLLRIDKSYENLSVRESFFSWLKQLLKDSKTWKRFNIQRLMDIKDYAAHGNKIIELFCDLEVEEFAKGVSKIAIEKVALESKLSDNENLLEKSSLINAKFKATLKKYEPKGKQDKDLVNHFLKSALRINGIPSLDYLASPIFSKSSWHCKLCDNLFLALLMKTVTAKIEHKSVNKKNKDTYLLVNDFIDSRIKRIKKRHSRNAGVTSITKPDYVDNLSNEIQEDFNNMS